MTPFKSDEEKARELAETTFNLLMKTGGVVILMVIFVLGYNQFAPLFHLPQASMVEGLGFLSAAMSLFGIGVLMLADTRGE